MPEPRNPLRGKPEIKDFLAALYNTDNAFDDESKAVQEIPPAKRVLARTRKHFHDTDDEMLKDVVLRAQAHQMAALFIRKSRLAAGLTTQQLATRMGVDLSQLSDAQSFKSIRKVPLDFLLRVAVACDVELSFNLHTERQGQPHRGASVQEALKNIKAAQHK